MGFVDKWVESLAYDFEILPSACVRHISPRSTCEKCLTACLEDAITFSEGKLVIDNQKCTSCGKCLAACPVQAVAGILPKQSFFQKKLIAMTNVDPPPLKELLIYHAKGVTTIACEEKEFSQAWTDSLEEVHSVLDQLGKKPFMIEKEIVLENSYSRRELFSLWKKESQSFVRQVTPAKWRFNHMDLDVNRYYPDYQFFDVTIAPEKCTLCKACEVTCPKTCFNLGENDFTINLQSCSGCMICQDLCPENAVSVTRLLATAISKSLDVYQKTCSLCKNSFQTLHDHDEKCPVCASRKDGYLSSQTC
ncbi:4Fe-4S dicluster domain-containing protein [Neobacillus sp. 19]|uniref:4Fe-4S dicluster domain-containing protein n=1 Tax=Neobacillus sp. 19 TaxID=3394458 RepID=UPI003BF658E1